MTIRWKLNLTVAALLTVLLVALTVVIRTVTENAERTRAYSRKRELSRLTSDIRTDLYRHLAVGAALTSQPEARLSLKWPGAALDDIDVQIRLAAEDRERRLWQEVRDAIIAAGAVETGQPVDENTRALIKRAENSLWAIRNYYELAEYDLVASVAESSLNAQLAIGVAGILTSLLFLIYLIMVRDWLVKPVEILKRSADTIGEGRLDHRVPLEGGDEMAQLARRLDSMAQSLARHQKALLESRELTAIGELCTNVAHGLRNPLAAIRACAQLAERHVTGQDSTREMLHDLVTQADRMDARISKMFQFSRPCDLHLRPTTFADLASTVQRETRALLEGRPIRLIVEDRTDQESFLLDAEQLGGVLAELVTNAAHHSPERSLVTLRADVVLAGAGVRRQLRIQVIDNGAGMSPATLEKAFDLFFTSRPDGTGMGLALSRRIVEKHGGTITITSKQGAGTTAVVNLPASPPAPSLEGAGSGERNHPPCRE